MLGDILKELRSVTGETQDTVAKKLGISRAAYSHLENNRNEPDNEMLTKLANHYQVTTDYLLGRPEKEDNSKYYDLSDKEKNDIAIQAEKLMEGIETGSNLNFYGEPATKEQKDRLLMAVKMAMEMNKMEAKKKFTPKKYRD
ncbi:helix-turn-helix transcriptional regulator [Ligilactobacillus agilis]|uniref:helix-turn-helix domain-containing protein n=1 Tax=Ligilactobacillus agilis TaxID=1601 RepID=UPI00191F1DB1|nr:helix-turn-helix transcriptional regulator [Ligilactobacillus agilis]MBL1056991.1 helix-turn-helix transcriptional regulator [Ligilactobacillus agilis]